MALAHVTWLLSAAVLLVVAGLLGNLIRRGALGILVDARGRYSLTQLQVTLWTIAILSLISGVFWARLLAGVPAPLDFTIPNPLLLVMGISLGSTVTAVAVKAGKDTARPAAIAASNLDDRKRIAQIFLVEEGAFADQIIDVTKFQNFWITVLLLVSYVALAAGVLATSAPAQLGALPGFSDAFVTLLGISHAGYLAGKLPDRPGAPQGLSVDLLRRGAVAISPAGPPATLFPGALTYIPRP
jgi:hypothetical protein